MNFVLPTTYPVTPETFNYAPLAVGAVLIGALVAWWLPVVGARKWYTGPKVARTLRHKPLRHGEKAAHVPLLPVASTLDRTCPADMRMVDDQSQALP